MEKHIRVVPVETTTSNALISCDGLGYNVVPPPYTGNFMPRNPDLSFSGLEEFVNEPIVNIEAEEEDVPQAKIQKKTVKPSFAKIEFVKSKEQVKSPRKTTVKTRIICYSTQSIVKAIRVFNSFKIISKVGTVAYRLELPEQLSKVHSTFHVSNLKKCLADEPLAIPLDEIQIDDKLHFIEELVEIMDREVKCLKQSHILIFKVRWNSRRGPEFTWEREDQMRKKYPHLFPISAPVADATS
ncbi:hypothetical protein Tco_1516897 [Tanacetum coccineum]